MAKSGWTRIPWWIWREGRCMPLNWGSVMAIAHPVGNPEKRMHQMLAQRLRHFLVHHGASHAGDPLVAFLGTDGKRQVPRTQHGVPILLDVAVRPPEIAAEEQKQFFPGAIERRAV